MFARSLCGSLLLFVSLAGLAAENPPMHARFLPPDDGQLRQEAPEQQQLIQITEYSVVLGNQRQSNQQPIPITTPTLLRLKGKPLSKGATLAQVLIQFDSEGKSLKKPVYDAGTRTLTLNYPLAQYPAAQPDGLLPVPRLSQRPCLGGPAHRRGTRALSLAARRE